MLQCAAVCYSVLQCAVVCCSVAACSSLLQYAAVCCRAFQCVAVCYSGLQCVAFDVAVCCRVLQCVAVCCSVLQCVAVGCSARSMRRWIGGRSNLQVHTHIICLRIRPPTNPTTHTPGTYSNTHQILQHTATHCNTLQHTATHFEYVPEVCVAGFVGGRIRTRLQC